jgi:MFS family permease
VLFAALTFYLSFFCSFFSFRRQSLPANEYFPDISPQPWTLILLSSPSLASEVRRVLSIPPFARYISAEGISMTGTWMQLMAQSWVMAQLTDKAIMLGLVNFAGGIPMLALTMIGGSMADKHDKRTILVVTQIVQIVLACLMGWLVGSGAVQIWHILAVAFLLGISNAFEMPSASALVPELVGRNHVKTAIAIDRAVFHGTRLIGPSLAGYAVARWGASSAFYFNALSYLALIIALLTLKPRPLGSEEEESQRRSGMGDGIRYVRSDKPTLAMISMMAATTVFVFPVMVVMLPLFVKNILHLEAREMGVLMGISGIGSLVGAVGLLTVGSNFRKPLLCCGVFGTVIALTGLSFADRFWTAASFLVLLSLSVSTLIGLSNIIVQERAPGPLRGRVSAIAGLSFFGLLPIAGLGITSLCDAMGMRNGLRVSAAIYLVISIGILVGVIRNVSMHPDEVAQGTKVSPAS